MSGGDAVVTLKLKVSNRESGMLEWRPCACSITNDFRVVLHPSLSTDSDGEGVNDHDRSAASTVVTIDLVAQLYHIEQKKKNKARCELVYASESSGRSSEELMAPSAKICQQWVERVREAQQSARRHVSIRQGVTVANSRAASASQLPRDVSSIVDGSDRGSRELGEQFAVRDVHQTVLQASRASSGVDSGVGVPVSEHSSVVGAGLTASSTLVEGDNGNSKALASSAVSNSSVSSSAISLTLPPAVTSQMGTGARGRGRHHHHRQRFQNDNGTESSRLSLTASNTSASSSKSAIHKRVDLSASTLSSCSSSSSSSESSVMDASFSVRFLPSRTKPSRFRSRRRDDDGRRYAGDNNDEGDDEDDEELSRLSPHSRARVAAALRRQRVRLEQRQLERARETTSYPSPHHRLQKQHEPSNHGRLSRRRRGSFTTPLSARSASIGSGLTDSFDAIHVSSIRRAEEYRNSNRDDLDPRRHRGEADDSSSKQELHMLLRVEEALRHLEHENAQRKQREEALAAQVQALKDALRVKSAEREHVASEFRAALHDKEKWQQAAQNAERVAGQLREELAIAREEAQLLARDKLRLKRQNGELLAQVHRLDSLVYGRF